MAECPNPDCRRGMDDLKKFVYGEGPGKDIFSRARDEIKLLADEIKMLADCVVKKVPKAWLLTFVLIFGLAIVTGGYSIFHKVEAGEEWRSNHKQDEVKVLESIERNQNLTQENSFSNKLVKKDIENIRISLQEMSESLKKIQEKIN